MHDRREYASQYYNTEPIYFRFGNGPSFRFYRRYSAPQFPFYSTRHTHRFDDVTRTTKSKKATYVQTVTVPLEVLHSGGQMNFTLSSTLLDRYKAAYRGGTLTQLVSQAALTVIMTWLRSQKVNWLLSLFIFGILVHANLPPLPTKKIYPTMIQRGWKSGTKIKYKVEDLGCAAEVIFIIREGSHDVYRRVGDDLHAEISVKARRLRRGCTVRLKSLSKNDRIKLKLRPRSDLLEEQVVVLKGQGWPVSNTETCGDLHVKIIKV